MSTDNNLHEIQRILSCDVGAYYEILNLEYSSKLEITTEQIKKAYKVIYLLVHPDKNKGRNQVHANAAFNIVHDAREFLLDENKKREYDANLAPQSTRYTRTDAPGERIPPSRQSWAQTSPTPAPAPATARPQKRPFTTYAQDNYVRASANTTVSPFSSTPPRSQANQYDPHWGKTFHEPDQCPVWLGSLPKARRNSNKGWVDLCARMVFIESLLLKDYLIDHFYHGKILTLEECQALCAEAEKGWALLCLYMAQNEENTFHEDVLDILWIFGEITGEEGVKVYLG